MKIIKVDNNWQDDVLNIDLNLGNYCNYKCWYCWPGSNHGTHKFPDLEILKQNLSHLINYYKEHTNKKVFDIHFCGGEPSHWPKLIEFIHYLKTEFGCLISMTSNGSKKMDWWIKAAPYFDRVHLSCHHEFVDQEHFRAVCDFLYEQGVVPSVSVMMDPNAWDKCMSLAEYFTKSKRQWTIRYVEIVDSTIEYTDKQKEVLSKHRARRVNLLWFLWHNKYYLNKVTVVDENGKKIKMQDNELLLKRLNSFYGWKCSLGVNWINISMSGEIGGTCNQSPYKELSKYNLYDPDFTDKFAPSIVPVTCGQMLCNCGQEINMPKAKFNNKKVIPIYGN